MHPTAEFLPSPAHDPLIPDILPAGLRLVLCGTAASRESARRRAYYARPGNQFWPVLHRAGFTPRLLAPHEYPLLPSFGIGLTDLCKTAFGNDDELPSAALDRSALTRKILACRPRWLAFTSKNAASIFLMRAVRDVVYGPQQEQIGETRLFVCPSTSGQARRWWREDIWEELARTVEETKK